MTPGARTLSVAAATLAELPPADMVTVAAGAGWDAAGIWFDPASWTDATTAEVRRRLGDTGLVALDMEPAILGPDGDAGDALVDAAAGIGAHHVLFASRVADRGAVAARLAELGERARPAGITVVLEFLPIFGVASLAQAVAVVAEVGAPNVGILVDSLHLARSGSTPADLAAVPPAWLPYLQVADAPAVPPDPSLAGLLDEALHGRSVPGEGGLPLADLVAAVPGVPLSVELRSRAARARWPDPAERARAVHDACRPRLVP